ncbi:VOC family protein [Actinokineospora bangkokensis]|uniref:Glyoxalase n=1 Tax=Actinokineospora bangkokensis TaxID=1193682 RepID=A0A1Q9LTM1_9PSEU|nr:VOC family protein [Actinokineospora bangkokensis]OLR95370.1 glyoxalase [Actinokineospora bangkokensis]
MEYLSSRILVRPTDPARSLAFYRDVLGLAVHREFPGGTVFFLGGGFLEVSGEGSGENSGTALWLQVRDLVATVEELRGRGAPVDREPRLEPWGLMEAWTADPDGLRIHLVEVPADHPMRRDPR